MYPCLFWRESPASVRPMLASLDEPPVFQRGLFFEPKYDGIRALVDLAPPAKRGAAPHVALYSRNGNDKTRQFPGIVGGARRRSRGRSTGRCSSTARSSRSTGPGSRSGFRTSRGASI